MPIYKFRARDHSGKLHRGRIEAVDKQRAAGVLLAKNYYVISINPAITLEYTGLSKLLTRPGILFNHSRQLAILCRQLALVLQSGIPLLQGLRTITAETSHKYLKTSLAMVANQIEEGNNLSSALGRRPGVFPELMSMMARAGEASGRLDDVMNHLADHFERDHDLREKVKSALAYPTFLLIMCMLATCIIFLFVLPRFSGMLVLLGEQPPPSTRLVLSLSTSLGKHWQIMAAALFIFPMVLKLLMKNQGFKRTVHRMFLKIPLAGPLNKKIIVCRYCTVLSMLIQSGVNIVQALEISKNVTGNLYMQGALEQIQSDIARGMTIARQLELSDIFPPLVTEMISIGESTGRLDVMLERIVGFYERDVRESVSRLSSSLEPLVTLMMAAFIGMLVASIILPMLKIIESILS